MDLSTNAWQLPVPSRCVQQAEIDGEHLEGASMLLLRRKQGLLLLFWPENGGEPDRHACTISVVGSNILVSVTTKMPENQIGMLATIPLQPDSLIKLPTSLLNHQCRRVVYASPTPGANRQSPRKIIVHGKNSFAIHQTRANVVV